MTQDKNLVQKKMAPERYAETFSIIKAISDERLVMSGWLDEGVLAELPTDRPLRFLSVGAGPGDFDAGLVARLLARGVPAVSYVAIEPSPAFLNAVTGLAERDARVSCQVIPSTYDDAVTEGSFDLILFFHSLYYMSDRSAAITRAIGLLVPGAGRLVLMHQCWSGVAQIPRHFVNRFGLALNPGPPSELLLDVFDEIERTQAIQREYSVIWTKLETTDVLDQTSHFGAALFDFLLNVAPDLVGPHALGEFRQFIDELSYPHAGRRWMMQPLGIFVVAANAL